MNLIIMAKSPEPGKVKTRLCPPCTPEQAADLAEAALVDTLEVATSCGADHVVLALAGAPGRWLPEGIRVIPQRGEGFAARLADAWTTVGGPAFQIGMDTPQLTAANLDEALARLAEPGTDAVLGPADDGGWWGLGLRIADADVFRGVPMSEPHTGAAQLARLEALGLSVAHLHELTDVDTIDDARSVATAHPHTRFAARLREFSCS